jgi:hypothetical protein
MIIENNKTWRPLLSFFFPLTTDAMVLVGWNADYDLK